MKFINGNRTETQGNAAWLLNGGWSSGDSVGQLAEAGKDMEQFKLEKFSVKPFSAGNLHYSCSTWTDTVFRVANPLATSGDTYGEDRNT